MPYVFYDTETTGISTAFSQILQFAAIKTDEELNEIDRFQVRCRLLPHIVPSPGALLVTGITPDVLTDESLPTHYEAIQEIRQKLVGWSPAIFIGYNSIGFDEELLRQAFFQTLWPPYLTNTNGNSRSDVMRIAHSVHMYRPNTLAIPLDDRDRETFRLDKLAPVNGFEHKDAHEAMADVEATIHVAKLAKTMAPDIWMAMSDATNKNNVVKHVMREKHFSLSERYFGKMYSWLVAYCGRNPDYDSQLAVFDLEFDPADYISLSVEELIKTLGKSPKAIRVLTANKLPIMMPTGMAPENAKLKSVSEKERDRRADIVRSDRKFQARVGQALSQRFSDKERSMHVELQIYDGFMSWEDQGFLEEFHEAPPGKRLRILEMLSDPRLKELGHRLLFFDNPGQLPTQLVSQMDDWLKARILAEGSGQPWTTIRAALSEVEALLAEENDGNDEFLGEVKGFLENRPKQIGLV
ncbi:MAG: exonuclease domain-containing protein [Pseudomonadota bacterium]|nr:exonuclease domain-containing protein [Pseudomonadota bacterium]